MNRTIDYAAALLLAVISWAANAANFDCGKASTKTEELICTDAELSKLDEELSKAYREAMAQGVNKDSVKQWQKTWLFLIRDSCADAACLKKVYTSHISQLGEHSKMVSMGSTISGKYERYYRGKRDKHSATINVFELPNNRAGVLGSAIWVGNAARAYVNTGEIDGVFQLHGKKVRYTEPEEGSCRLTITFEKKALVVTDDNSRCGGLNVSFNGEYRRICDAK